ncbi:MAG: class I SAM-dependent methyltransferase [Patescibacteria group bacterium]
MKQKKIASKKFPSRRVSARVTSAALARTTTSWDAVADWYDAHLATGDTYHDRVILPNIARLLAPTRGRPILEIGCGEGRIARSLEKDGHRLVACDISAELIKKARAYEDAISYHVAPAEKLTFAANGIFHTALAVMTLQNMERLEPVFAEVARVLSPRGRLIAVINHPAFRVPRNSSWGFDAKNNLQYRRIDKYLSAQTVSINMHPGGRQGIEAQTTKSYHRSLQDYIKALRAQGFALLRLEEWISDKVSEPGKRADAENTARKEFPLFMAFEAIKIAHPGSLL